MGLTQDQLAKALKTSRKTINFYEAGTHRIPGSVELALLSLASSTFLPLAGTVAAGRPIEPFPQAQTVEVPLSMARQGKNFALRVKGESMRDDGILTGDIVVVRKQSTAHNGQMVVALVNGEATIKRYIKKANCIELHPANPSMEPILVALEDKFRIEGIVVGLIRHIQ